VFSATVGIRLSPINPDEARWGAKTVGRKEGCGGIILCGRSMSAGPRVVQREHLNRHVSVKIIGGSGIHLNYDRLGLVIRAKA
jgi:hypothetical protein